MASKLKINLWNANGLSNKIYELKNHLLKNKIDICLITETKLTENRCLKVQGYTVHRQDRGGHGAGGVAALVKNDIPHRRIHNITPGNSMEVLGIKLQQNTTLVVAYNRPLNTFTNHDLDTLFGLDAKVVLAGDFNAKHPHWNCHTSNSNGNTLLEFCSLKYIDILHSDSHTLIPSNNTTPTTIDLVLSKNLTNISKPTVKHTLTSDHNVVQFYINNFTRNKSFRPVTSYKNTDWSKFRRRLDDLITINNNITDRETLDREIDTLTKHINTAKAENSKTYTKDNTRDVFPEDIQNTITQRNRCRKLWQQTGDVRHRQYMTNLNQLVQDKIKTHKNKTWEDLLKSLNTKNNTLYKLTKLLRKPYKPIPALQDNSNTNTAMTDAEKAELLANTFQQVHSLDDMTDTPEHIHIKDTVKEFSSQTYNIPTKQYATYMTSPTEIQHILKTLPTNKAPGPDRIENKILKNLSRKAIAQLHYICNAILKLQYFPTAWKHGHTIPIHKQGKDPNLPLSYRPITLLNTMAKLTERIILTRLLDEIQKLKVTNPSQFGFTAGLNTTLQVTRIVKDVIDQFNKDKVTVMTLLDIAKAFDRIWIEGLIYKMLKYRFSNYLIKLVLSYLTDRSIAVRVNDTISTTKHIHVGVPQGSVLAPTLFNIYINDTPSFPKTNLGMFADDMAIYAHSFSAQVATKQTQIHIDIIKKYCDKWKIRLNADKTETIVFARKRTNHRVFQKLTMDGHTIIPKTHVKYLGVTMDSRLNFDTHLKNRRQLSYATMRKLYSLMKSEVMTSENKRALYKVILRPIITYACPAWANVSKTRLRPLQVFQNKCLRLATGADRYTRLTTLHDDTQVEFLGDHITRLSEKFYKTQIPKSTLTKHMTQDNTRRKYLLPFQNLPSFKTHTTTSD